MSLQALANDVKERSNFTWQKFAMGLSAVVVALVFGISILLSRSNEAVENKSQEATFSEKLKQVETDARNLKNSVASRLENSQRTTAPQTRILSPYIGSNISIGSGQGFATLTNNAKTEAYIPTGSFVKAELLTTIKTSITATPVIAEITHDFQIDSLRRVPKGSRLIGTAMLDPMLRGVTVRFQQIVTPKKQLEFDIRLLALSYELFAQLTGIYFSNEMETYGTALAAGFIQGFSESARSYQAGPFGSSIPKNNISNRVLGGVSSASFQVADEVIADIRRRAVEYVVVLAGSPIYVIFTEKFVFKDGKPLE